ncbi:hypothetical protein Bcep1808_1627 [Burkholderia vietnamiensis G4]|uniref:Uncharacterized protein n=1 Tax=Burkholderia vietnamiensis (strain G4 / LMG 22486) TaxID=269482 RepID=A4JED1_BURVG|nr:hypothetical protein Bcep1808_1627 [Burkholderia vietnamiensis G4]
MLDWSTIVAAGSVVFVRVLVAGSQQHGCGDARYAAVDDEPQHQATRTATRRRLVPPNRMRCGFGGLGTMPTERLAAHCRQCATRYVERFDLRVSREGCARH